MLAAFGHRLGRPTPPHAPPGYHTALQAFNHCQRVLLHPAITDPLRPNYRHRGEPYPGEPLPAQSSKPFNPVAGKFYRSFPPPAALQAHRMQLATATLRSHGASPILAVGPPAGYSRPVAWGWLKASPHEQ
jgi:hypothetical protein